MIGALFQSVTAKNSYFLKGNTHKPRTTNLKPQILFRKAYPTRCINFSVKN